MIRIAWPFLYRIGPLLFQYRNKILQSFVFFKCRDSKAAVALGQVFTIAWPFLLRIRFKKLGPPQGKRRRLFGALGLRRSWLALFESLKRLGGDEQRLGFSVLQQASNGIVKTSSYVRPFALLTLGNEFPSEPIGRIV